MALFLAAGVVCIFAYRPPPRQLQRLPLKAKLARLDWVGYGLLASGLVLFCVWLSFLTPYTLRDPEVAAPLAIRVFVAIALGVYEHCFITDGMFHHGLFKKDRHFALSLVCVFSEGIGFFAANHHFAFQLSVLYTSDALFIGLNYGIVYLVVIPASLVAGLYCTKTKRVRGITVLAFALLIAFFACMATTTAASRAAVWGYPVLLGAGLSMTLVALLAAGQLSVPPTLIAVASSMLIAVRSLGGTVGIAVYDAVFNAQTRRIPAGLPAGSVDPFVALLVGAQDRAGAARVAGATSEIVAAGVAAELDSYVQAFRYVWLSAIPFMALAAIAAMFLIDPCNEFNHIVEPPLTERDHDREEEYS